MKRLQTVGLVVTLLLVAVLAGSAVWGVFGGRAGEGAAPGEAAEELQVDGGRLRVEVLNAAGVPGLARTITRELRQRNFDVVFFGNAPGGARDTSVVVDRVGRLEDAERIAEALGIRVVRSEPDTTLYLEATVIIGRDVAAERAPEPAPAPTPSP